MSTWVWVSQMFAFVYKGEGVKNARNSVYVVFTQSPENFCRFNSYNNRIIELPFGMIMLKMRVQCSRKMNTKW